MAYVDEQEFHSSKLYPVRKTDDKKDKIVFDLESLHLPNDFVVFYKEAVNCYNNDLYYATAAVLRMLTEAICKHFSCTQSNIQKNIKELGERGLLSLETVEVLQAQRFIGNSAIHKFERPTELELSTSMELIQHIFKELFMVPNKRKILDRNLTKRYE